jgi:acetoin utilization protein AcuB
MRENRISSLVVMENNKLVGIITESDIFDAFIDLLGFRDAGSRITVEAADVPGAVATIGGIFSSFDANITHIAVYRGNAGKSDVVIRTNAINTDAIEKKLEEHGYKIVHLIKSEK